MQLKNLRNPRTTAEELKKLIRELDNLAGLAAYDLSNPQDYKLSLIADEEIKPAKFKLDIKTNRYRAHPRTIEALKKNILLAGDDLDELSIAYECYSCKESLDIQFWHFCPHCGGQFKDVGDQ